MKTTYTKVHMSDLKDDDTLVFSTTKAQSSPKKWGIHIQVWDGNTQAPSPLGWIDDEDFLFYATEQERDKAYTQMAGEQE